MHSLARPLVPCRYLLGRHIVLIAVPARDVLNAVMETKREAHAAAVKAKTAGYSDPVSNSVPDAMELVVEDTMELVLPLPPPPPPTSLPLPAQSPPSPPPPPSLGVTPDGTLENGPASLTKDEHNVPSLTELSYATRPATTFLSAGAAISQVSSTDRAIIPRQLSSTYRSSTISDSHGR